LDLSRKGGFQAAAEVFGTRECDPRVKEIGRSSAGISFLEAEVVVAADGDGGLSRSGTEGSQSGQGTPVESIKKCWKSALSPLKTG
jgi:hypothetical protein